MEILARGKNPEDEYWVRRGNPDWGLRGRDWGLSGRRPGAQGRDQGRQGRTRGASLPLVEVVLVVDGSGVCARRRLCSWRGPSDRYAYTSPRDSLLAVVGVVVVVAAVVVVVAVVVEPTA